METKENNYLAEDKKQSSNSEMMSEKGEKAVETTEKTVELSSEKDVEMTEKTVEITSEKKVVETTEKAVEITTEKAVEVTTEKIVKNLAPVKDEAMKNLASVKDEEVVENLVSVKDEEEVVENLASVKDKEVVENLASIKDEKVVENLASVKDENKTEAINYSKYNKKELVEALESLMQIEEDEDVFDIKKDVEIIRSSFYKIHNLEKEKEKADFAKTDGDKKDFKEKKDEFEIKMKELYKKFKELKSSYHLKLEKDKEDNLKKKFQIIEEIKDLVNKKESINKTFDEFKNLQKTWKKIGNVPQTELKNLWETYHHNVEKFYDFVKINRELRDLDLKKNLENALKLCEQAEELLLEENVIKAFGLLQKYHEQWRELGPVHHNKKDEVWERFKKATTIINKKHFDYFDEQRKQQEINLKAKNILLDKVEEIEKEEYKTHKDWDEKSKNIIEIQGIWKSIGFAPRKENNKIYFKFREICDNFFNKKREFYLQGKEEQNDNLQQKIDLCMQAESLQDSEDWKKTTGDLINIQKEWKEIGPVPRAESEKIWKRFRKSCDTFFNNKEKHFKSIGSSQDENLKLKLEIIENLNNFKLSGNDFEDLEKLKNIQKEWMEIGFVPFAKKDKIYKDFREAINKCFDNFRAEDVENQRFKIKIESMQNSPKGSFKLKKEKDRLRKDISKLENDIKLWENNIGFFAKSKNAEALINDVKEKIEKSKEKLIVLKEKFNLMKIPQNFTNKKTYKKK